ncbi:hypothetical protein K1719_036592 [Acacia pycnantha]|nr:hypothetical protein K1719_036592 [Acacia pycnantha]
MRAPKKIYGSVVSEFSLQYHTISCRESLLTSLLVALNSSHSVSCCRAIHARVLKSLNYRDGFIGDQLVSSYISLGFADDAEKLFDEIPHRDVVSWNSLISGFSKRGDLTCTSAKARNEGQYLHGIAVKFGMKLESKIANSLINMYGKLGCLDSAFRLFLEIPEPNLVSWNSMVAICTQNGIPDGAFQHFNMMKHNGFLPDEATVVALLQACENLPVVRLVEAIHAVIFTCGLNENVTIATSLLIFGLECDDRGIRHTRAWRNGNRVVCEESKARLDHYSCMVDLLGRRGLLNDAYELIKNMPLEPNAGVWGALLGACRVYRNIDLGKEAAEKMIALDPLDSRNYIMLSNIYSASGLWDDASKVRASMKAKGVIRNPGISFIEHGKKIHRFVVDDYSHPDADKIHEKLEELVRKIHEAGFVPETDSVLHNVDEEVKMGMINKHSEKIALAYGLLVTSSDEPIVIMKNLRICRDCHSTAKLVSLIEKRAIIIRDSKRFHQFLDGSCSCGDYW